MNSLPLLPDHDATLAETLAVLEARERQQGRRRLLRGLSLGTAAFALTPLAKAACVVIPSETAGPYPGDGTNGPNALTQSGIVRSDMRASFGSAGTTVAAGTPLTVTLQLVNTNANCAPLVGYAIYLWHCDAQGRYSLYSSGVTTQNYLRGVQITDSEGKVTFTTIFPGAYAGRWPHMHFEIYSSLAAATVGSNAVRISQLALPDSVCREVFAQTALYPGSLANHNQTTLANDNVFANDSAANQLASVTGSISAGYVSTLTVGLAAAAQATTGPDINQHGMTGLWYNAASSGQGIALEVFANSRGTGLGALQGGWFTYDVAPAGGVEKQRWYTFGGNVASGSSAATVPIYLNTGGNFNASPVTTGQTVGSATITFSSCTEGQLAYSFTDGSGRSGTIALTRLMNNVTCSTSSTRATSVDYSLSGNWYNPATSGQGFIVEINPTVPVIFFAWYTYAVGGQSSGVAGQRWYTGQANYVVGAKAMVVTLYETKGGVFNTSPTSAQTSVAVGTATLTFSTCTTGTLAYSFTGGSNAGQSGTIALTRAGTTPAGCVV